MRTLIFGLLTLLATAANWVAAACLIGAQRCVRPEPASTPSPAPDERTDGAASYAARPSEPQIVERYFVEAVARRDDGAHITDGLIECVSAEDAVETAAKMARAPGYCASWAFSRKGYPEWGFYQGPETLARFGGL